LQIPNTKTNNFHEIKCRNIQFK